MSNYRLIVSDIDGTLIGADGEISENNVAALRRAVERGVKVALCTGRVLAAALRFVDRLGLDGYHIFSDGALVRNPATEHDLYLASLAPALLAEMTAYARQHDLFLEYFTPTEYLVETTSEYLPIRRFFGIESRLVDFDALPEDAPVIKGGLICDAASAPGVAAFLSHFEGRLDYTYAMTPAFPDLRFFNLVAPGVSKGRALGELAAFLEIPLAQTLAIGDADNDRPLFRAAGLAVAMGNAPDAVRREADYVTADVDHDGVAAAIEKFVLGD
jgi:Cof subfamily protein (haloacid dehalogenase superfamily)